MSFGLGSFFAPILVKPFLLPLEIANQIIRSIHPTILPPFFNENDAALVNATTDLSVISVVHLPPFSVDIKSKLNLRYPYQIIGGFTLAVLISLVSTSLYKPGNKPHPTRISQKEQNKSVKEQIGTLNENEKTSRLVESKTELQSSDRSICALHKSALVVLGAIFLHLIYGAGTKR